jgi:hypothetical protein
MTFYFPVFDDIEEMDFIPSKEDALKFMGKVICNVVIIPLLFIYYYVNKLKEVIFPTFKKNGE